MAWPSDTLSSIPFEAPPGVDHKADRRSAHRCHTIDPDLFYHHRSRGSHNVEDRRHRAPDRAVLDAEYVILSYGDAVNWPPHRYRAALTLAHTSRVSRRRPQYHLARPH